MRSDFSLNKRKEQYIKHMPEKYSGDIYREDLSQPSHIHLVYFR